MLAIAALRLEVSAFRTQRAEGLLIGYSGFADSNQNNGSNASSANSTRREPLLPIVARRPVTTDVPQIRWTATMRRNGILLVLALLVGLPLAAQAAAPANNLPAGPPLALAAQIDLETALQWTLQSNPNLVATRQNVRCLGRGGRRGPVLSHEPQPVDLGNLHSVGLRTAGQRRGPEPGPLGFGGLGPAHRVGPSAGLSRADGPGLLLPDAMERLAGRVGGPDSDLSTSSNGIVPARESGGRPGLERLQRPPGEDARPAGRSQPGDGGRRGPGRGRAPGDDRPIGIGPAGLRLGPGGPSAADRHPECGGIGRTDRQFPRARRAHSRQRRDARAGWPRRPGPRCRRRPPPRRTRGRPWPWPAPIGSPSSPSARPTSATRRVPSSTALP